MATLLETLDRAAQDAEAYQAAALSAVRALVAPAGKVDRKQIDGEQHLVHGLGWVATYAEALRQIAHWARKLDGEGKFGAVEQLLAEIVVAEYSAQLAGGVLMTQVEMIRPADFGIDPPPVRFKIDQAKKNALAAHLHNALGKPTLEHTGLDEDFELIRDQFRKFAEDKIIPFAHQWHLNDEFIPMSVLEEMGALGVFGLTIPEEYGGSGMGKTAMCVVSEELSRAWIGTGSLGTRSEIAAELILTGGTEAQKQEWLPKLASAEILPTAVFTEPNTGSDLGSLRTRAVKEGDSYIVTGNKTWITHAARADVMTLLVRTDPATDGFAGLSMLLAPKLRGDDAQPFPTPGMSGGEIKVIGYRGMKEYEIGFDGFKVPAANL
ncbi:MAG: acyl-CoA dehydrogenase family protein, partial [Hyphomonadaceae bacterium]